MGEETKVLYERMRKQEESKNLHDFNFINKIEEKIAKEKQQTKIIFITTSLALYLGVMSVLFVLLSRGYSNVFFPFRINATNDTSKELEQKILRLEDEIKDLNKIISSSTPDKDINFLREEIAQIKSRQNAFEESIALDPEKALTAGLLRAEQKHLSENMQEIKEEQVALRGTFANLIITIVVAPIVTAILAGLGWFLKGFLERRKTKK